MKRKKCKREIMAALLLILMLCLGACGTDGTKETKSEKGGTEADSYFGDFSTVTIEGDGADQSIFAGRKLTMVNIWGTFCDPCIREMPDLGELSREYEDQGMQIVGLISDVTDAGNAQAEEIIDKTNADYTHILATDQLYQGVLAKVEGVPTTVFVDEEGRQVGETYLGAKTKEKWKHIIDEMLKLVKDE